MSDTPGEPNDRTDETTTSDRDTTTDRDTVTDRGMDADRDAATDRETTSERERSARTETAANRDRPTGRDATRRSWMLSGIASLLGLWILASAFVYDMAETGFWNNVVLGAAILLIAGYNNYRTMQDMPISVGGASLVAILGLWVLVSPAVLDLGSDAVFWSNVVSGALVALIAAYNAYETRQVDTAATTGTRT